MIINQYGTLSRGINNVSAGILPDMKGSANGTVVSASGGTNGYISTSNNNGNVAANTQRVDIAETTFRYVQGQPFTQTMIYRTSRTNAKDQVLFSLWKTIEGTGGITWWEYADYKFTEITVRAVTNATKRWSETIIRNIGKWLVLSLVYDGNQTVTCYVNGIVAGTNTVNNAWGAGAAIYTANAKFTIFGGLFTNVNSYSYGVTGDLSYYTNANNANSIADIQNTINEFNSIM